MMLSNTINALKIDFRSMCIATVLFVVSIALYVKIKGDRNGDRTRV